MHSTIQLIVWDDDDDVDVEPVVLLQELEEKGDKDCL